MPVIYKHGKFQFAKSWKKLSFGKQFGLEEGSTYFNWDECRNTKIGQWRMPTRKEWQNIIDRNLHEFISVGKIGGYIFYPDNYIKKVDTNVLSDSQLDEYIKQGCVFLPLAGYRYTNVDKDGNWHGWNIAINCWTSTFYTGVTAYYLHGSDSSIRADINGGKSNYHYPIFLIK